MRIAWQTYVKYTREAFRLSLHSKRYKFVGMDGVGVAITLPAHIGPDSVRILISPAGWQRRQMNARRLFVYCATIYVNTTKWFADWPYLTHPSAVRVHDCRWLFSNRLDST